MVKSVFDLDMTPGRMLPLIINVSQYDDIGRTIVFNLYSSVGAWTAPTSASVTFEGGKRDGKFFAYNCAYSNGIVTVTIQQQMTAVAGKVRCKVKVKSGDKVVESAPIIMVVDAAAVPDGSDMSKTDINDAVANATQKIVDQVKDNIPSDYSQLSTDVSSLKEDIDNLNEGGLNLKEDFIGKQVNNWLDDHPEATTTVQDGVIGEKKIEADFLPWIKNDYVTPEMFGAVGDGVNDDTNAIAKAIANGKRVLAMKQYVCKNLNLIEGCELVIEGKLILNGTITINNPQITIKGNGTIKVNSQLGFLLYGTTSNACRDIRFKDIKIIGTQTNTCIAITNANDVGYVVYVHIDCDIVNFMYGIHSYSTYSNKSWFTSISVDGLIENCNRAIHFEWGGTGSYIKAIIQPCVNAPKSDNVSLILIGSNCILDCMIWDIDSANNIKAIKITGTHNKINCPIRNEYIDIEGIQAEAMGYATPYICNAFKNVSSAYSSGGEKFPVEMVYDNSNDISLMAGNNTINLEVTPKEQTNNAKEMLSGTRTEWYIDGKNYPEITLTFDFPKPVALRECFVAGENMPQSVKFEYKNKNKEYVELKTCKKNIDYVSGNGSNNYAFWQFSYGKPESYTKKFAYGVKITIKSEDTYRITRIYMGITDILFANKNGDDIIANTLLLKSGNDYYNVKINGDGTLSASKSS